MRRRTLLKLRKIGSFSLLNFATPVAFFLLYKWVGAKPAIGLAVGVSLIQVAVHRVFAIPFSPFFIVATVFTVLFGGTDLLIDNPRYYRLEPFAQNFVLGVVFLGSRIRRASILNWFIAGLPRMFRPNVSPEMGLYLHRLTLVWALYFLAKATLFLYLAFQVDLGELIVLRSVIGGGTLVLMVAGEVIYRKYFRRDSPRSTRNGSAPRSEANPSDE